LSDNSTQFCGSKKDFGRDNRMISLITTELN